MDDKFQFSSVKHADAAAMLGRSNTADACRDTTGRRVLTNFGRRLTLERRLHRLANYDSLAGLPAHARESRLLDRWIAEARRSYSVLALISLHLDGLRLVYEAYGRAEADAVIKHAVSIVRAVARPNTVIARNGTDGFILLLAGLANATEAASSVQQILEAIAVPHSIGGEVLRISASAGIAMFPGDGGDLDTLSRNAFAAIRESKPECHDALRFHSGNVALAARRRLRLETDLHRAIENNELTLHYQPQFDVRSGVACGVEVLARWFQSVGTSVEPSVFIPLAEEMHLIGALGSWVLHEACKTVHQWRTRALESLTLCVNVSAHQIDETLPTMVRRTLERTGFPAKRLELEITESALIGNAELIIECLRQLKTMGVRIAIDDFGTGYCSLSYLSRLPVDRLKLDKSLVHNMSCRWKDVAILRSVIALGKELGVAVIAEGVESEQQFQMLKQLGCRQVQGYLFARPAPQTAALRMLTRRWGARKTPSDDELCAAPGRAHAS